MKTGLNIGGKYAKYHLRRALGDDTVNKEDVHRAGAETLFKELSELRGTALKLAQSISMDQSGLLPSAYTEVLTGAQYKVPPMNRAIVRNIIHRELGAYPEQCFAQFDSEALAAASIGQVHRATSHDGQALAIKIQYPNVRESIKSDLTMAKVIFKRIVTGDNIDPYFDEVYEKLLEETDYVHEARQLVSFAERFNNDHYATPQFIPEYSTEKVLAMSFLEGKHLDRFLAGQPSQQSRNHFGQRLWDFFHDQILNNQTIHADTHPGNFLFMDDGRLGIIDFGCVKVFPKSFFDHYMRSLPLHLENDPDQLRVLYRDLELIPHEGIPSSTYEIDYLNFIQGFAQIFAEPYRGDSFDFGNPAFNLTLQQQIQSATRFTDPRGSRHFVFASRVHIGLYTMLIRLGAHIDVTRSKAVIDEYFG